jgi:hypothetical protein
MTKPTVIVIILLALAMTISVDIAIAQQRQHLVFSTSAENSKYTEKTENLELGDVPDHILRVFEIRRNYPDGGPVVSGIKIQESWVRGSGDRTAGIGPITQYVEFIMENGDKIFARMDGIVESSAGKGSATIAGRITNGTGKFATIQGTILEMAKFDIKIGSNENRTEMDYSTGQ